jgi:hypothetical protein
LEEEGGLEREEEEEGEGGGRGEGGDIVKEETSYTYDDDYYYIGRIDTDHLYDDDDADDDDDAARRTRKEIKHLGVSAEAGLEVGMGHIADLPPRLGAGTVPLEVADSVREWEKEGMYGEHIEESASSEEYAPVRSGVDGGGRYRLPAVAVLVGVVAVVALVLVGVMVVVSRARHLHIRERANRDSATPEAAAKVARVAKTTTPWFGTGGGQAGLSIVGRSALAPQREDLGLMPSGASI